MINVPMLKNSDNKESASFTMTFIAFNLVSLWLVLSIVGPIFGIHNIPEFDGTSAMAYLSPVLANYFAGKYITSTTSKNSSDDT